MHSVKKTSHGGSQAALRKDNIARVVNALRKPGLRTKKEIAIDTGLSFAKVNSIYMTLNSLGLIAEAGKAESNGGRPSAIYQINPDFGYTIGCELSHKKVNTIGVDLTGKIHSKNSISFDIKEGKNSLINKILIGIRDEIENIGKLREKQIGIGIAVAGLVNPQNGMSTPFPHLVNWGDIPFKEIVEKEFGLFCHVENVANAAALAEQNFGVHRKVDNILAVNVGSGLGLGIIINGKLYTGVTGSAGEFGHITVDENGPLCMCGNVGCLETLASTTAVVIRAKRMIEKQVVSNLVALTENNKERLDFRMICESAEQGDKLSFNLLDEMGKNLGEGIVTLINLLNPNMIIIGGEICCAKDIILQPIMTVIQKRALEVPRKTAEVVFSTLGSNAGIIGSVIPVIEHFFSSLPNRVSELSVALNN